MRAQRRRSRPEWCDLLFLYDLVRERQPGLFLELGSGCSTAVIAHALRANGQGRLLSIDAEERWADSTRAALEPRLAAVTDVEYVPAEAVERDGVGGWVHERLPDLRPDILYVDGPALTEERNVGFDALDLEERLAPGACIVVDGRITTVRFVGAHLTRPHRLRTSGAYDRTVIELLD